MKIETAIKAKNLLEEIEVLKANRSDFFDRAGKVGRDNNIAENKEYLSLINFTLNLIDKNIRKLEHELSVLS